MVGKKVGTEPTVEDPHGKLQELASRVRTGDFYAADAVIAGDTVVVSSDKVPQPAAVPAYTCTFNPAGTSCTAGTAFRLPRSGRTTGKECLFMEPGTELKDRSMKHLLILSALLMARWWHCTPPRFHTRPPRRALSLSHL